MKHLLAFFLVLFLSKLSLCQPDSVYVKTGFKQYRIASKEDLKISIHLYNNSGKPIEIPKKPKFSVDEDKLGEVLMELEYLRYNCYTKIVTDVEYGFPEENDLSGLQKIAPHDSISYECDVQKIFLLDKSHYRLRVHVLYFKPNEKKDYFAKSDWVYFEVPF